MALLNVIDEPATCPKCGDAYNSGFEIDEGKKVRAYLKIGDSIPFDTPPSGERTVEGLGKCLSCGAWITAAIQLYGGTIKGIGAVGIG